VESYILHHHTLSGKEKVISPTLLALKEKKEREESAFSSTNRERGSPAAWSFPRLSAERKKGKRKDWDSSLFEVLEVKPKGGKKTIKRPLRFACLRKENTSKNAFYLP